MGATLLSIVAQILPQYLLPNRHRPSLHRHQRPALPATVLVRETAHALVAEGLGAGVCGVGACVSEGAVGERECAGLGHCVRDGGAACGGGGGGGVGVCAEEERGRGQEEGGDEDRGESGWRGKGGEERALDLIRDACVKSDGYGMCIE